MSGACSGDRSGAIDRLGTNVDRSCTVPDRLSAGPDRSGWIVDRLGWINDRSPYVLDRSGADVDRLVRLPIACAELMIAHLTFPIAYVLMSIV